MGATTQKQQVENNRAMAKRVNTMRWYTCPWINIDTHAAHTALKRRQ
jgi:hypothetical protein